MTVRCFLGFVLCAIAGICSADAPRVVVTIKPIHSLVSFVMGSRGEPTLLLQGFASPHAFQLRTGQAQALQEAELVVWVGEQIETFMPKVLDSLASKSILMLSGIDGLRTLPNRGAGVWSNDSHDDEDHHQHDHAIDGHYWLDPANAQAMARAIAERLSQLDPANSTYYHNQASELESQLQSLDTRVYDQLATARDAPFIVLHDAFQYFESRYDLQSVGSITTTPDAMPSAKRVTELRELIKSRDVRCIFIEAGVESALSLVLAKTADVRIGELAPLGASIEPGPMHYQEMILLNTQSLVDCLSEQ